MAGKNQSSSGPQSWAFLATGPCVQTALAASTTTLTLSQFVSTMNYPPQVMFWNIGAAAVNSHAFVAFAGAGATAGATVSVTVSATNGTPVVALQQITPPSGSNDTGMQILSTGKTPTNVLAIGSAGTTTVYLTPGEGSR